MGKDDTKCPHCNSENIVKFYEYLVAFKGGEEIEHIVRLKEWNQSDLRRYECLDCNESWGNT